MFVCVDDSGLVVVARMFITCVLTFVNGMGDTSPMLLCSRNISKMTKN